MAKQAKNDWPRTKAYRELKQSLLDDLDSADMRREPYLDLVEQYMDLWCLRKTLKLDLDERGVSIAYQNGSTQKGVTDNKSLSALVRVEDRMSDILGILGYKARAAKAGAASMAEDDDPL